LASFFLPKDLAGEVLLTAELEVRPGVIRPLVWACEQRLNSDGSISITLRKNDDPAWRKGV
jgi:hypothetical protein